MENPGLGVYKTNEGGDGYCAAHRRMDEQLLVEKHESPQRDVHPSNPIRSKHGKVGTLVDVYGTKMRNGCGRGLDRQEEPMHEQY